MEQSALQQIRGALKQFSAEIHEGMDKMKDEIRQEMQQEMNDMRQQMNQRFDQVDQRLDRMDDKFKGLRAEFTETQETVDYLASKSNQHEKKLRNVAY
ncbi:hypothetical protein WMZ97_10665 [Lentibacillus sp. N15]|uniref:hypothetical protein n=1 Tax=Lentibacillus songyuanensis TaxID=3136161 RepID=UPI0031BAC70A